MCWNSNIFEIVEGVIRYDQAYGWFMQWTGGKRVGGALKVFPRSFTDLNEPCHERDPHNFPKFAPKVS